MTQQRTRTFFLVDGGHHIRKRPLQSAETDEDAFYVRWTPAHLFFILYSFHRANIFLASCFRAFMTLSNKNFVRLNGVHLFCLYSYDVLKHHTQFWTLLFVFKISFVCIAQFHLIRFLLTILRFVQVYRSKSRFYHFCSQLLPFYKKKIWVLESYLLTYKVCLSRTFDFFINFSCRNSILDKNSFLSKNSIFGTFA